MRGQSGPLESRGHGSEALMGPFTGSIDRLLRSGGWTDQHEADIGDSDETQDFP
jgi:hypothetical protein